MIDYFLFGLTSLSFIFVSLSIIFMWKEKEFEDKRVLGGLTCLLAGMVFLAVFLLSKALYYGFDLFNIIKINIFYFNIVELVTISLMVIFFLVGMILMREV